jgi:hypothetical protein
VAAATGDLDGDGYDNEIVTIFRDSDKHLQCLILRRLADQKQLDLLWHKRWTDHDRGDVAKIQIMAAFPVLNTRPLDVTAGDIDGDQEDEVILAFRDGYRPREASRPEANGKLQGLAPDGFLDGPYGHLQLVVLDFMGLDAHDHLIMDDRVFVRRIADGNASLGSSVSVSAADLDGDGRDEIAVGYVKLFWYGPVFPLTWTWQQFLFTYEQMSPGEEGYAGCWDDHSPPRQIPCLHQRAGDWSSSEYSHGSSEMQPVVLDTGDLDLDGAAEIAMTQQLNEGDLLVQSFDADSKLSRRGWLRTTYHGSDKVMEHWLAMGDIDGDTGLYIQRRYLPLVYRQW